MQKIIIAIQSDIGDSMHLIYIDDSADEKLSVFSALTILDDKWNSCFEQIKKIPTRGKDE